MVYALKKNGHQILLLSEDNQLYLSHPLSDKEDLRRLEDDILDYSHHPSFALGPGVTRIPIDEILRTKVHGARGLLDIETTTKVHRIGGFTRPPTVANQGEVSRPISFTAFGGPALEDIVQRINARRLGTPEAGPGSSRAVDSSTTPIADVSQPTINDEIPQFSFLPLPAVAAFLRSIAMILLGTTLAYFSEGGGQWFFGIGAFSVAVQTLVFGIPGRLKTLPSGVMWGTGLGRRFLLWDEIEQFEIPPNSRLGFRPKHITVILTATGMRVPLPFTAWLRTPSHTQLVAALEIHRPCRVGPGMSAADSQAPGFMGHARIDQTKPMVTNTVTDGSGSKFWRVGIPLATIGPVIVVILFIMIFM